MASWFRREDGELRSGDKDKLDDVEFKPEKLKEEITAEVKTHLDTMRTEFSNSMKPLNDMAAQIAADRAANNERIRKQNEQKNNEDNEVTTEDYILDPQAATQRQMQPLAKATMMLAARMARQDTLAEKEYYYGDIKNKVDAMIDQQPLNSRSRADVIENCYKLVMFDHQKDVAEGKIKARNTGAIFEGGSTGAHSGKGAAGEEEEVMSSDEKMVASKMGISDKDWIKSRRELSYV